MVVCLAGPAGGGCRTPLCASCGRELVPDDRVSRQSSRAYWRQACECAHVLVHFDANDQDLALMGDLVVKRGLPRDWAARLLTSLADSKTMVVVEQRDGTEIAITFDEARDAIGHDFGIT